MELYGYAKRASYLILNPKVKLPIRASIPEIRVLGPHFTRN